MAVHPRRIIREAVAEALKWKTAAKERVYMNRQVPWAVIELPGISVYAQGETSQPASVDGDLDRSLQLKVTAGVAVTDSLDDALDSISLEVEQAMAADQTFGGVVLSSSLASTDLLIAQEGAKLIGVAEMVFDVTYSTAA